MSQLASAQGATTIMVIRHAEKPDTYGGQAYAGVTLTGSSCGKSGTEDLVTLGWQRAGGLVTLFAAPWGPKSGLATPQFLYASDPDAKDASARDAKSEKLPSQRPYETLLPVAAKLGLTIDTSFTKKHYDTMVTDALAQAGVVLIAWQHEDIPLQNGDGGPGISQEILTQTGTTGTLGIPATWPETPEGQARYDLVWVFNRPSGTGPIASFTMVPQLLLAGDLPWSAAP